MAYSMPLSSAPTLTVCHLYCVTLLKVCSLCHKANEGRETARFALRPVPALVFSGVLTKSNDLEGRFRNWKQRLCLLDSNGVLTYFKNYVVQTESPVRCSFLGRILHSRMPLDHTPARLKRASV